MFQFKTWLIEEAVLLHDKLNPDLWVDQKLRPEVRSHLMLYAKAWASFAIIPESEIIDIVITGSNANFNYKDDSDIDVHLIINRDKLGPDRNKTDGYLNMAKVLWTIKHKILIHGHPVEPYAQDVKEELAPTQGVYSIKTNRWLQFPSKPDFVKPSIAKDVDKYKKLIDTYINKNVSWRYMKALKKELKTLRINGIQQGGEYSAGNLIFKELRSSGYLEKMNHYVNQEQDRDLSLG